MPSTRAGACCAYGDSVARRLRSLSTALTVDRTLLLLIVTLVLTWVLDRPIGDPDLGWHLETGEWIWRHRSLPLQDPFGYPTAGVPWLPYSWLAEIVFWWVTTHIGAHAFVIGCALLFAATFGIVYQACRAQGAAPGAAAGVTLLGGLATYPYYSQRPVVLSFFALAVCAATLWRATRGGPASAWKHFVLFVLWANVHVFFIVGLAWLWAAPVVAAVAGRRWQKYVPVALAATAATFCTPFGFDLHRELLKLSGEPVVLAKIVEFMSPDFHTLAGGLVMVFLLALFGSFAISRERPPVLMLLLIGAHTALALYMQRNIPILAVLAAPAMAVAFTQAWALDVPSTTAEPAPLPLLTLRGFVIAAAVVMVLRVMPTEPSLERLLDRSSFPVAATHFIRSQPPLGRMFNPFGWGGYLVNELYPAYQVSIDGRTTTYGTRNAAYLKTAYVQDGWQSYLDALAPDFVIWPRGEPFAQMLANRPEWARVYADPVAVIYVRADHPLRAQLRAEGRRYAGSLPTLFAGSQ